MNKKKLIFLGLDVLVLVITIGVSLAVFNYVGKGNSSNVITSGYIRMNYTGNSNTINLPIATPTSDEDGRNFGLEGSTCQNDNENNIQCYFDFIVSTNMNIDYNVGYEVTLEKDEESTLTNDGVRVYLEKQNENEEYQELFSPKAFEEIDSENQNEIDELGASNSEMLLDNGTINSSTTYYYRLRIWLAKDYKGLNESVTFSAKVNVYGSNAEVNSANGISLTDNGTDINGKTITIQKGNTKTISAEVLPENAKNKNLIWESSDTNKVKIDSVGNITAVDIGTSVITISTSDRSKSATFTINVVNYDARSVELNTKEVTLSKGNTYQLTSIITPTDAEDTSVTYKSSSEGIATISNNGLITAVGVGETTITVETINGYTDTCKVIVTEPNVTNISINGDDNVDVGSTIQLSTTITSDSLESSNVVWTSSDESKAIVSSIGKVTGISTGIVTITAYIKEYPDMKATKTIEVQYPKIKSITMSSDVTIYKDKKATFMIALNPAEVRNKDSIVWTSSNESVATIPETCNGNVYCEIKGIDIGTTIITAKTSDTIKSLSNLKVEEQVSSNVTSITLDKIELTISKGKTKTIKATIKPEYKDSSEDNRVVTWNSSDESIAIVNQNGEVTGVSEGNATITASYGGISTNCSITIITMPSVKEFVVGDYVSMTPSVATNYTPSTNSSDPSYTGCPGSSSYGSCTNPGTINPKELNKWIVIRNDEDATELVSLYVSSSSITFFGRPGYKNYIRALNTIAKQYENSNFTKSSRHIGYLPGSSLEQCGDTGGADTYYTVDTELVKNATGIRGTSTLKATTPSGLEQGYFLASRVDEVGSYNSSDGRYVTAQGVIGAYWLYGRTNNAGHDLSYAIRPIITLKSDVVADSSGDGSESNPWVLVQ